MNLQLIKLQLLLKRNGIERANFLKKKGIFSMLGQHCYWHPYSIPSEPYLMKIHDNVTIASDVSFYTHDVIDYMLNYYIGSNKLEQFVGPIEVFDNVFIGAGSKILYNTKIGPNAIVAAGSVVVSDVPKGAIVGGNPARVIGSFDELLKKRLESDIPSKEDLSKLVNYFWKNENK